MYIFADDAKFYRHIEHPEDQEFLQLAVNALHQWSEKWLLSLYSNKCHVVSYGRTIDKSAVFTIMDKNQQTVTLARLDKIKDIGVYVDAKLDFKDHMHEHINKAYMMLGLFNRNFKHMSIPSFVALYKSMVRMRQIPFRLLLSCLVTLQKRRYRGFREGPETSY